MCVANWETLVTTVKSCRPDGWKHSSQVLSIGVDPRSEERTGALLLVADLAFIA